jgi:uncharacterized membrane protein
MPNSKTDLVRFLLERDDANSMEEEEMLHLLLEHKLSQGAETANGRKLTFGQRAADAIARFAGSWTFIIAFIGCLLLWIIVNTAVLASSAFDEYPFILLNLILSCVAAIQAPVIMMSQNRQEAKDRLRSQNDYKINLKSEIIIEDIHRKLDQLLLNQERIEARLNALENVACAAEERARD